MPKSSKLSSTKKNANNANNASDKVEKCMNTYCKNIFPAKVNKNKKIIAKQLTKKMNSKEKKIFNKNLFEKNKDTIEREQKICKDSNCNPTCKNTIFESGKKIPKEVFVQLKTNLTKSLKKTNNLKKLPKAYKMTSQTITFARNSIFNKKTNVLKDDFYEKLPVKLVKKLKKEGAISGCSMAE